MDTPLDHETDDYELFLKLFTQDQMRLLAYIRSFIFNPTDAYDVYQESCLVLWRSFGSYDRKLLFTSWALGIARHQILHYFRSKQRDKLTFSDNLMSALTLEAINLTQEIEPRLEALQECLGELTERQHHLIKMFYGQNMSADAIALVWGRSVHTVYKSLKVMRRIIFSCVESKLVTELDQ
jgi:RNA polymerase sigma-70 factor (ECF subfamily)